MSCLVFDVVYARRTNEKQNQQAENKNSFNIAMQCSKTPSETLMLAGMAF